MARAKSSPKGSKHHNSKLTEEDARLILQLMKERKKLIAQASHLTVEAIAKKFEVSKQTIQDLAMGRTWKHI